MSVEVALLTQEEEAVMGEMGHMTKKCKDFGFMKALRAATRTWPGLGSNMRETNVRRHSYGPTS